MATSSAGSCSGWPLTKALIWAIALGSGTSGGVLAPLLIMGGSLGAIEAQWIHAGDTGLWAMISMAAIMGGTMRSPLTAVAFMLELTDDIHVLPALFIACVGAQAVTVLIMRRSILTEKVARRGYHVMREYIVNPLSRVRVDDVMQRDVPSVPGRHDRGGPVRPTGRARSGARAALRLADRGRQGRAGRADHHAEMS